MPDGGGLTRSTGAASGPQRRSVRFEGRPGGAPIGRRLAVDVEGCLVSGAVYSPEGGDGRVEPGKDALHAVAGGPRTLTPYVTKGHGTRTRGMTSTDRRGASGLPALLTGLVTTALGTVAGILIGGWLAFEWGGWRGFKSTVENLEVLTALDLGIGLLVLAFLVAVLGAYARRTTDV